MYHHVQQSMITTSDISCLTHPNRFYLASIHTSSFPPAPGPSDLQLDDVRHTAIGLAVGHVFRCDATKGHLRMETDGC